MVQVDFRPGWFSSDQLGDKIGADFLGHKRLKSMLPVSWLESDVLWRGDVGVLRMGDSWVEHLCLRAQCKVCGSGDGDKVAG